MRKLALKLDQLEVQSFATTPSPSASRGTVRGHVDTEDYACTDVCSLVVTCNSCEQTCGSECDPTDTADAGRRIILY